MLLSDLDFESLQKIGYILENHVDRRVRGRSKEGILDTIKAALGEVSSSAREEISAACKSEIGCDIDFSDIPIFEKVASSHIPVVIVQSLNLSPHVPKGSLIFDPTDYVKSKAMLEYINLSKAKSMIRAGFSCIYDGMYSKKGKDEVQNLLRDG